MSIIDDKNSRTPLGSQRSSSDEFGMGEIVVGKINAQNTTKKFSKFIPKGRSEVNIDGTVFMKSAKGNIYVSDYEIICGNVKYPFSKIIGIIRSNNNLIKSVETTIESIIEDKRYHIKLEIITNDSDKLFTKLSRISMRPESDLTRNTMKNQSSFLKDRFGLRRN